MAADLPPEVTAPERVVEWLDGISRTRRLTDHESVVLEKALNGRPLPKREAARMGLKRNMEAYRK